MLQTNKHYARLGLAFERKIGKILLAYGAASQVPAAGGYADFVISRPLSAVVEVKRTLRSDALAQAQRYALALGLATIALVGSRLAAPPEAFGVSHVLTSFDDLVPGVNVILWR